MVIASYRKKILPHLHLPLIYGIIIGILLTLLFDRNKIWNFHFIITQILYSTILSYCFWLGNSGIAFYLSSKYSWLHETRKIIIWYFILIFSFCLVVVFFFNAYIWFVLMKKKDFVNFYDNFNVTFYICISLTVILTLLAFSTNFFREWKQSVIDGERMKREALMLEYESLKNQVNPHFLFNNLNVLTALIEQDRDGAVLYVKKLSDVYRYVLDRRNMELIPFEHELEFIQSYIYLLKIRFGDKLECIFDIQNSQFLTIPLALQLLLENAVKHNEISMDKPLKIHIYDQADELIVENNLQIKDEISVSSKVGLKTLEFQFEYLSGKKIVIDQQSGQFSVRLPKIPFHHANTDC